MLTVLFFALLAVGLAAGLFFLAVRFMPAGEQLAPVVPDEPLWSLPPDRALDAEDVSSVRIPVALRGYRFAETDLLLDRLSDELRKRDELIARLRGGAAPDGEAPHDQPMLPYEPADGAGQEQAGVDAAARPVRAQREPAAPPQWWRAEPVQGLIADPAGAPIVHRLDEAPTAILPLAEIAELEQHGEVEQPAELEPHAGGRRRRKAGEAPPAMLSGESSNWWSRMTAGASEEPAAEPEDEPPQPESPTSQPEPPASTPPASQRSQPSQPDGSTSGGWSWQPPPGRDDR